MAHRVTLFNFKYRATLVLFESVTHFFQKIIGNDFKSLGQIPKHLSQFLVTMNGPKQTITYCSLMVFLVLVGVLALGI